MSEHLGWLPVPGFPGYYVDGGGALYSVSSYPKSRRREAGTRVRLLRGCVVTSTKGYRFIQVEVKGSDGRARSTALHILVCLAHRGERPAGAQASHLDGNSLNCVPANLAWETPKQNNDRKLEHGTAQRGETAGHVKLTAAQVAEIRRLYATGQYTKVELGRRFGVSRTSIYWIVTAKQWRGEAA